MENSDDNQQNASQTGQLQIYNQFLFKCYLPAPENEVTPTGGAEVLTEDSQLVGIQSDSQ